MGLEIHSEGVLNANGEEQVVTEITETSQFSGYISLSNLQTEEGVTLRQYIKLLDTYEKYAEEVYSGIQAFPMVCFAPKNLVSFGCKVTLEQTSGSFRSFRYKFIKVIMDTGVLLEDNFLQLR